jgi:ABC-type Fe3+-hydroxamate transport system substrate-binding protein
MIQSVGIIVGRESEALALAKKIRSKFDELESFKTNPEKPKACYLIWKDPYLSVGGDTFINNMMEYAGLENVFHSFSRYPEIQIKEVNNHCDLVLLSSEPFPFSEKHIAEIQALVPRAKIVLVDGEMFSWYGSRLLLAGDYFRERFAGMEF